jgi:hypothetical protein
VLHFPPPSFTQPAVSRLSHRENTGTFVQKLHCDTREKFVVTPTLQKPEGFRVKASEGEVVVFYFEPSATQDLNSSGFPEG